MELHLRIRFLDNRFHGFRDAHIPEWPPSPFRLFQALIAGAKAAWSEELARAFAWMEGLDPPIVHAPIVRTGKGLLIHVRNNNGKLEEDSRAVKFLRPSIMPVDTPYVDYFWHFEDNSSEHVNAMIDCFHYIRAVGWGIDMAIGSGEVLPSVPPVRPTFNVFTPQHRDYGSAFELRVPRKGTLESLENNYRVSLERVRHDDEVFDQPGATAFNTCLYSTSLQRPFCAFAIRHPESDDIAKPFSPRSIKKLVGMIRRTLGSDRIREAIASVNRNADSSQQFDFDQVIFGHPKDLNGPRLSILTLPSIGHQHSDADIRRVILAEPFGGNGNICGVLSEHLNGQILLDSEDGDNPTAQLVRIDRRDKFVTNWYLGPSREWATVSPVLLPGFDARTDRRRTRVRGLDASKQLDRALELVAKSLSHADIAVPARIEISALSWWPGVPHASDFVPREKLGPCPRYHVKLTFDRPFAGPLSLGRQRHMGLGVFAALNTE